MGVQIMKRALLNSLEPGRICEVVEIGKEFEVASSLTWIDCPDDITTLHTYIESTGEFKEFDFLQMPSFISEGYKVARQIAYTSVGNQLDMLFKELQQTGTISSDGPWATHVAEVKATIPKDDPAAVMAWNVQHAQSLMGNV
jgi:hypothetical protein